MFVFLISMGVFCHVMALLFAAVAGDHGNFVAGCFAVLFALAGGWAMWLAAVQP